MVLDSGEVGRLIVDDKLIAATAVLEVVLLLEKIFILLLELVEGVQCGQ